MKIGKYFSLDELTVSQAAARNGISNQPTADHLVNLKALVENILDPLREHYGPVRVSSAYRSPRVNTLVGGAKNSQHMFGQAADINITGVPVTSVVATIRKLGLPFDQLIDEFNSWTHVSYVPRGRREVLKYRRVNGQTVVTRIP